ncbi:MAG: hypothetical protein JWO06_1279 [Bacteroidota bacterium]|nr:hypothetical protein [Bacteroidota bacterium]
MFLSTATYFFNVFFQVFRRTTWKPNEKGKSLTSLRQITNKNPDQAK